MDGYLKTDGQTNKDTNTQTERQTDGRADGWMENEENVKFGDSLSLCIIENIYID
jgi:hypothetical protein